MNIKQIILTVLIIIYSLCALPAFAKITLQEKIQLLKNDIANNCCPLDAETLSRYSNSIASFDNVEKVFLNEVLDLMKKFRGKTLSTNIDTIADFDGDGEDDKISSRVYEKDGKIKVSSVWIKNNEILWTHSIENPYQWIGESDLFQSDTRDIWVIFTIAIKSAVPKAIEPFGIDDVKKMIIDFGVTELNNLGVSTTKQAYSNYLNSFSGKLLVYGEPACSGVNIWYPPAKKFIIYYHP